MSNDNLLRNERAGTQRTTLCTSCKVDRPDGRRPEAASQVMLLATRSHEPNPADINTTYIKGRLRIPNAEIEYKDLPMNTVGGSWSDGAQDARKIVGTELRRLNDDDQVITARL